jgi:transposase-like protein
MAPGSHEEDTAFGRADGEAAARGGPDTGIEVAKKHGISDATIYAWRKRYGQLAPVDVKRLRPRGQAVFEIRAQPDLVRDHAG